MIWGWNISCVCMTKWISTISLYLANPYEDCWKLLILHEAWIYFQVMIHSPNAWTWWCNNMVMFSTSSHPFVSVGNPSATCCGFPSQMASDAELLWFFVSMKLLNKQLRGQWLAMIRLPCDDIVIKSISYISMVQCKNAVTPLLTHWSYCSLALSHWVSLSCTNSLIWDVLVVHSWESTVLQSALVIYNYMLQWASNKNMTFMLSINTCMMKYIY